MRRNGNITLVGEMRGFKPQRLSEDPSVVDLRVGLMWFNTAEDCYKYYDGTEIKQIAVGTDLTDYLRLDGGTMTAPIVLHGDAKEDLEAVTLQQLNAGLETKQPNIKGAATSIVDEDLTSDKVVVTSETGKIVASDIDTDELNQLEGINTDKTVQEQIDSKQDNIGYETVNKAGDSMEGDLHFGDEHTVTDLRKPVNPTDAVRLIDLENMKAGLDFQADVLAVQTDDTLEDDAGDTRIVEVRFIVTDKDNLHESFGTIEGLQNNDIIGRVEDEQGYHYEVVYAVAEHGPGVLAWARDLEKYMKWDGEDWTEHGGLSGVTASNGLDKDGNTIFIKYGAGAKLTGSGKVGVHTVDAGPLQTLKDGEVSDDDDAELGLIHTDHFEVKQRTLGLAEQSINNRELHTDVAGHGLAGGDGSALRVVAENSSIVVGEDGVKLGDVSEDYLKFDVGGTLSAHINVQNPENDAHPTTKRFVDNKVQDLLDRLNAHVTRFEQSQFVFSALDIDPQSAYAVDHNFGNIGVVVSVYDENMKQIIPDEVELVDENRVDVRLADEQRVLIVVQGLKAFTEPEPEPEIEGSVDEVTLPEGGNVVLGENETYKFTVDYVGEDVAFLEMDINVTDPATPELARIQYTLAANEADPYNGVESEFSVQGVTVTYSEAEQRWVIDFGPAVTTALVASGQVKIYSALRNANGDYLWGDMYNTTEEMRVFVNLSRE